MGELRFDDRVVAITGANHGLGQEHAMLLARRGAKVVVNDIGGAAETVRKIREFGGTAMENTSDITDPVGTDQIVRAALDAWGRLDAVINNAAWGGGTLPDPEMVQGTIAVHLIGTINLIRSSMPTFRRQKYGRIVNTGSGSILGIPMTGVYAAGKGGVLAHTRVLANELAAERAANPELDIRVNLVMPAAQTPNMPRVPDERFQSMMDAAFAPEKVSPLVALLAHQACPVNGEAIQSGAGRQSRFILATTAGWQAPGDNPTPENILENWAEVMAGKDLQEPVGTMSDLLGRRGEHPYSVADLIQWARSDPDNPIHQRAGEAQRLSEEAAKEHQMESMPADGVEMPSYDELPLNGAGRRLGWRVFGADDQVGRINLQTPARTVAAARLIRKGALFPVNTAPARIDPPLFLREPIKHEVSTLANGVSLDDKLDNFYPQAGAQWDSLSHVALGADEFYNGNSLADALGGKLGIDAWARRGIAGRAVLLDLESALRTVDPDYSPGTRTPIGVPILERALAATGVRLEAGDVVLLYTGFLDWYSSQSRELKEDWAARPQAIESAGLEDSEDVARWLWDHGMAGIAADNPGLEAWRPEFERGGEGLQWLHSTVIGSFGMAVGELWDLGALVRDCRADGVWEMFLASAPLNIPGGCGSTANALLIK